MMIDYYEEFAFGIIEPSANLQQWLTDITVSSAEMWGRKSKPIFGKSVDEILEKFEKYEYKQKYLIIQSPGHFIHSKAFFGQIGPDLSNSLFVGHVLFGEKDCAPYLHEQCIAVNIMAWRQMEKPLFESHSEEDSFPGFSCPKGHWHDQYTPKILKRVLGGHNLKFKQGSFWIRKQLGVKDVAFSFNEKARNSKFNIYTHSTNAYNESMTRLKQLQQQFKRAVYFHETDQITKEHNRDVTTLVTVASGLRVPRYINNYPNLRHIIIYDISYLALEFQRMLRNFEEPYIFSINEFKRKYPHAIEIPPSLKEVRDYTHLQSKFDGEIPGAYGVRLAWSRIPTNFICEDLIDNYEDIIALIGHGENVVFDVSNVYTMPLNYVERTNVQMEEAMNNMVALLSKKTGEQDYRIFGFTPSWVPLL